MREYLPKLKSRTDLTAVQNTLTKLISLVEQAGKPKEKHFSLPKVKLPKLD